MVRILHWHKQVVEYRTVPHTAAGLRHPSAWQDESIYRLYKLIGKELKSGDAKMTSIWRGVPEGKNPHPAPFPLWLPARVIISILEKDEPGVVLDPYVGSGTTAVAAKLLGHHYVGIDVSPEYLDFAQERLENAQTEMPKIQAELELHGVGATFKERKQRGRNVGRYRNGAKELPTEARLFEPAVPDYQVAS